jgi:hypothetical protein
MNTTFQLENVKMSYGKHIHKWEDNNKMDLTDIGCGLDLSCSGLDPVTSSCECGNGHSCSIKDRRLLD